MAGPGAPKTGGREKGTPNKLTADVRAMILAALDHVVARTTSPNRRPPIRKRSCRCSGA
jgi:hypothetical protein